MNINISDVSAHGGDKLESLISRYMAASPGPSRDMLAEWVGRYPEYEQELTNFTADWVLAAPVTPPTEYAAVPQETLARHLAIARGILDSRRAHEEAAPIEGLVAQAQTRGLSRKQLASALDLSIALVDKLDRRLVRFVTIPAAVVELLARTLATGVEAVEQYLQGPSLLPQAASYRAERAPAVPPAQSFAEAVEGDRTLSPERKGQLLALVGPDDQLTVNE